MFGFPRPLVSLSVINSGPESRVVFYYGAGTENVSDGNLVIKFKLTCAVNRGFDKRGVSRPF